jgi:hypothetical protein
MKSLTSSTSGALMIRRMESTTSRSGLMTVVMLVMLRLRASRYSV